MTSEQTVQVILPHTLDMGLIPFGRHTYVRRKLS
eukprot:COSAG01_NODE_75320_length_197_cov_23.653061_1_plen_33_part_10